MEISPSEVSERNEPTQRSALGTIVIVCVLAGVACGWLNAISLYSASGVEEDVDGNLIMVEIKTPLFYATHAVAIACITCAGLLAAVKNRLAAFGFATKAGLYVLAVAAAAWTVASYSLGEAFSPAIFGATGPFVWWTLILVAAGAEAGVWPYLKKLLAVLAFATAALSLAHIARGGTYAHYAGFSVYTGYSILLAWLGGWLLLSSAAKRGWRLAASAVPYAALVVTALYAQSRSWLLNAFLLGVFFLLLRARESESVREPLRVLVCGCMLLAVLAGALYAARRETLSAAVEGLTERLEDDTRSGQYKEFFARVPLTDLILGRGPKGLWYSTGVGKSSHFDNGYIWTLFDGGLPMLLCYSAIVFLPGFTALLRRPSGDGAAAALLVLLWGIAFTGLSTFIVPSLGLPAYLISLCAGRAQLEASA